MMAAMRLVPVVILCLLFPQTASGQYEYWVPQVVDGYAWEGPDDAGSTLEFWTTFKIVNLSAGRRAVVRVEATKDSGEPMRRLRRHPASPPTGYCCASAETAEMPPSGNWETWTLRGGLEGTLEEGWAKISSDQPIGIVVILQAVSSSSQNSWPPSAVAIPVGPLSSRFTSLLELDGSLATGFALFNPSGTTAAEITVSLRRFTGELYGTRSMVLEPHGKTAQFLNEENLFPELDFFYGTAEITSSQGLAAMVVQVNDRLWAAYSVFAPRQ